MRKFNNGNYNFLVAGLIANTPALNDIAIRNWGFNVNNVLEHYNSYLNNVLAANSPGPIEKHPYIDSYGEDCDFQREILVLGTFPPSSYFNNLGLNGLPNPNINPNGPNHYYYGNTNDFWDYLLGIDRNNVNITKVRSLLSKSKIAISDVFSFIQRNNMIETADSQLFNIVLNCNLSKVFMPESQVTTILFTSGKLEKLLDISTSALTGFRWILEDCCGGIDNFEVSGDINGVGPYFPINVGGINLATNQQNGGIVWWLKYKTKKIRIVNLPSPSRDASRKMPNSSFCVKWVNYKLVFNGLPTMPLNANTIDYVKDFPAIFIDRLTKQYRREVYQMVLNNTIHLI